MKIVFFSTSSEEVSDKSQKLSEFPKARETWLSFLTEYPETEISFVVQKPGRFLLDGDFENSPLIKTIIADSKATAAEIASLIENEKPDMVIPVTYWAPPFDWLSLKDSLISSILREKGITCAGHPEEASLISFSKKNTHDFLEKISLNFAKAVFVDHQMYKAEVNYRELSTNVYKEFISEQIKKLSLPLVIKSTSGLSSWGMDVTKTLNETFHILNSKRTNGDRLVEEFLEGDSFGIEIYGSNKKYAFSPLLINSVNQFGLTSPKQNVKLGDVKNPSFRIKDLHRDLSLLANALHLDGIAQVDLVFHDEKWYIIEINSRISGMTETAAAAMSLTLPELLIYSAFLGKKNLEETEIFKKITSKISNHCVMNMKFPLLCKEKLEKLYSLDYVVKTNQIENLEAKQLREQGYSEIIFGKTETLEELMEMLEELKNNFPDEMEEVFYNNAKKLYEKIRL